MSGRIFWLLLPSFIKIFLAASTELSVDESHYVNYGRWLDWSYYDHPPLVGWVQALFAGLPFHELTVRLPALLMGVILFLDIDRWLRHKTGNEDLAFWITQFLQVSPILAGMTFLFLPETPLLLFSWLIFRVVDEARRGAGHEIGSVKDSLAKPNQSHQLTWLLAIQLGLLCGLAGLSKYTAILLVPGILWEAYSRKWWKAPLAPLKIFTSAALALFCISPVIYWNVLHDFSSFRYQSEHVVQSGFSLKTLGISLAGIVIGYGIFLSPWVSVIFYPLKNLGSQRVQDIPGLLESVRWAKGLILFPVLFFVYAALTNEILPHWPALMMMLALMMSLLMVSHLWPASFMWVPRSVGLMALVNLLILSQVYYPVKGAELISRDIVGWKTSLQVMREMKSLPKYSSVEGVITSHWTYASRAVVYFSDFLPVHLVDERKDQYDFWLTSPAVLKDYFVLYTSYESRELKELISCGELRLEKEIPIQVRGTTIFDFQIWLCRQFKK